VKKHWAAWGVLAGLYWLLLGLEKALTGGEGALRRWGMRILLALIAGFAPVAISQMESRFAEEEFFVALQALELSLS